MSDNTVKSAYVAPSLRKVGRVEQVTAGTSTGATTDGTFPIGTPFGDVTFS